MNFILNNNVFDNIINIFLVINSILLTLLLIKEDKKDFDDKKNDKLLDKNYNFKISIIIINLLAFMILAICYLLKNNLESYFIFIYYCSSIFVIYKLKNKNFSELTQDNKMSYIPATYFYVMFFSNKSTQIYLNLFSNISHIIKEYLLIVFLIIKLILFIFFVIIHTSLLISSIRIVFKQSLLKIKKIITKFLHKSFKFVFYNFYFSNKHYSKLMYINDCLIYIILCPISITLNLIFLVFIKMTKYIFKKTLHFDKIISSYLENSSKNIKKSIRISLIIALSVIYIIIVYNPKLISNSTKEVYNLLITVILIPLIYDSIKQEKIDRIAD